MITLQDDQMKTLNRRSSKGNQLKFEKDGFWYKADHAGYEGLAEYAVSNLLRYSTLGRDEFVLYEPEQILYRDRVFNGCKSADFTGGWQLITLERLFTQAFGKGLNSIIYSIEDHTLRLKTTVDLVQRLTGIPDFGKYLAKLVTVDAVFLNEDRHTHNIAVMTNDRGEYKLCPIFDNGASLLSDTTIDYPLGTDCLELMKRAKPSTFCQSFEEQVDIAEELYGEQIRFAFGYHEIKDIIDRAPNYPHEIRGRVIDLILNRRQAYGYLFRQ